MSRKIAPPHRGLAYIPSSRRLSKWPRRDGSHRPTGSNARVPMAGSRRQSSAIKVDEVDVTLVGSSLSHPHAFAAFSGAVGRADEVDLDIADARPV